MCAAHATKTVNDFRFPFERVSIMIKIVAQPIDVQCNQRATRNEDDNNDDDDDDAANKKCRFPVEI